MISGVERVPQQVAIRRDLRLLEVKRSSVPGRLFQKPFHPRAPQPLAESFGHRSESHILFAIMKVGHGPQDGWRQSSPIAEVIEKRPALFVNWLLRQCFRFSSALFPHTRGETVEIIRSGKVFPTRVGMVRGVRSPMSRGWLFPTRVGMVRNLR